MDADEQKALYKKCVEKWGVIPQLDQVQEECAELIVAISHLKRGRDSDHYKIAEETADVEIMCGYIRYIIGDELVEKQKQISLKQIQERVMRQ